MKQNVLRRSLSLMMILALLLGLLPPAGARFIRTESDLQALTYAENGEASGQLASEAQQEPKTPQSHDPEEIVRVSIVLEDPSALEMGYTMENFAHDDQTVSYRSQLQRKQEELVTRIQSATETTLDVVWNLTLAANVISANVPYGQIETISAVDGVREVSLEAQYLPCVVEGEGGIAPAMATSPEQTGIPVAYALGYTGAGSRIAVIDTGLAMEHQSFSVGGYEYSLAMQAAAQNKSLEEYKAELNLLTQAEIASVLEQLNASRRTGGLSAGDVYKTSKIPFGYNYIDNNPGYVDHNLDAQGGHGSHVAGIVAANRYLLNADGTFSEALETVAVQGVAPDAQILVMKVFGIAGGAFESDYVAAIEDAMVLDCDAVNMSLSTVAPGYSRSAYYQGLFDRLEESEIVVVASAGNNGHFADSARHEAPGYLYAEDVATTTSGSPGTFANSLGVASVDNVGTTAYFLEVAGQNLVYHEYLFNQNSILTIAGQQEYIYLDNCGTAEDFAAVAQVLQGKVALCSRGEVSFSLKANAAVENGAIATIVYDNQPGVITMDLTDYRYCEPAVSVTQEVGQYIKSVSTPVTDETGKVLYYTGTMTVHDTLASMVTRPEYYTMSSFSGWGVPGDLSIKPEITAPGGNIYSVDGDIPGGKAYVTKSGTSMSAPQVAGMIALLGEYLEQSGTAERLNLSRRALIHSLLMSTATAMEQAEGQYYPVLRQGAGLANIGAALNANSYILMQADATDSYADGKVKAELGDDPERKGEYTFSFTLNDLAGCDQQYILSAELFTQGLLIQGDYSYMDTATADLMGEVTWTVNGQTIEPSADVTGYDFNNDGLVNLDDVQTLLDAATGADQITANHENADLNDDGLQNSYDAYCLLNTLNTGLVSLKSGQSVEIGVTIKLTQEQKDALSRDFVNGAYVEGFIFATQVPTDEGVLGTTHSIPLLAFYGNWSDPSMFDQGSHMEQLYGVAKPHYVLGMNKFFIGYQGEFGTHPVEGNPYMLEEKMPVERLALQSDTRFSTGMCGLIRNAAAVALVVFDEDGEIVHLDDPSIQIPGSYLASGIWVNEYISTLVNKRPATLGFEHGDRFTLGFVAVPEYYEVDGNLDKAQLETLMGSGKLGDGVFFGYTFTVDDTAPELLSVQKDLVTGNLVVSCKDNNFVAAIQLQSPGGRTYTTVVPEQNEAGQVSTTVIDMSELAGVVGEECVVVIGDYARNETAYTVSYGGGSEDYTGKLFGFSGKNYRGDGRRFMEIDPENLWYYDHNTYGGTVNLEQLEELNQKNVLISAAEYVGGYVYMADDDGSFYVAHQSALSALTQLSSYTGMAYGINAMAFNYANETLYALDSFNNLWSVDLYSGGMEKIANINVIGPAVKPFTEARFADLTMMTIDTEGNFYLINGGNTSHTYLYRFTLEQIENGRIDNLAPVGSTPVHPALGYGFQGSMAWDHDTDTIYFCGTNSSGGTSMCYLMTIDPTTGQASMASVNDGGYGENCASMMYVTVPAMYTVPSMSYSLKPSVKPSKLQLDRSQVTGLVGNELAIQAEVFPWNLEDKSVVWSSSDENVATVTPGGWVSLVGQGEATITATSNADPSLSAICTVTVEPTPNVHFSAHLVDDAGKSFWVDVDTDALPNREIIRESNANYYGGALMGYNLVVHDGKYFYTVDADTFRIANKSGISEDFIWSDAAPAGINDQQILGLSYNGKCVVMLDPAKATVNYWDLSMTYNEQFCAIARHTEGTYIVYPAEFYYVLAEDGSLWQFTLYTSDNGKTYNLTHTRLGYTGLELMGVSNITDGQTASMIYDEESGYLVLAARISDGTTHVYMIQPESQLVTELGDFGSGIWPVTTLYQYDRVSQLSIRSDMTDCEIFAGDGLQFSTVVLPDSYENKVLWSSSDESVATVDEMGRVSALNPGQAVITATTVAVDDAGQPASISCVVTVKSLTALSTKVNAQIVTASGPQWVSIDTGNLSYSVNADAYTTLTGAGVHDGMIYGTNSDFVNMSNFYRVDPNNGFKQTTGTPCGNVYAIVDLSTAPREDVTLWDYWGQELYRSAYGYPFYAANTNFLGFLTDFDAGELMGWSLPASAGEMSALTLVGASTYRDVFQHDYTTKVYYALGADGILYRLDLYAYYSYTTEDNMTYKLNCTALGDTGARFANKNAATMTYVNSDGMEGLVIGYSGEGRVELYYIDLTSDTYAMGKVGNLPGATAIAGLYTDAEVNVSAEGNSLPAVSVPHSAQSSIAMSCAYGMPQTISAETIPYQAENTSVLQPHENTNCIDAGTKLVIRAVEDANSGIITVEFDEEKMELKSIEFSAEFQSFVEDDGKLTIGYVSARPITDIAVLTFAVVEDADITVTVKEENASLPNASRKVTMRVPAHEYKVTESQAATCTEDGYVIYTCSVCGESYTEMVKATGHDYKQEVIESTCTEAGYTKHTCSVCGHSYMSDVQNPKEHDYKTQVTAPTCTDMGYTTYTCAACGHSYASDYVAPTGHKFGEWTVTKEATCVENGEETRTCACGETETRSTFKTDHKYETAVVEPTCTEVGYTNHVCTVCGHNYITDLTQPTGHDYEATVTAPTCTEEGYTTYTCTVCGETYVDDIVPATGHTFGEWVLTTEPGCTEAGEETRYCADCDATETREVAPVCPAEKFSDVDTKQWYHEGICYVIRNGLMNGKSETIFAPNANLTRAELVTVLYRMAGEPSVEDLEHPFTDVADDTWYTDAVIWAYNAEVVKGISETAFAPNANITREQIATILYRYAGAEEVEEDALADFADAGKVNAYAVDAMNWAVSVGLINGVAEGELAPQGNATRAQIATILMRYCEG